MRANQMLRARHTRLAARSGVAALAVALMGGALSACGSDDDAADGGGGETCPGLTLATSVTVSADHDLDDLAVPTASGVIGTVNGVVSQIDGDTATPLGDFGDDAAVIGQIDDDVLVEAPDFDAEETVVARMKVDGSTAWTHTIAWPSADEPAGIDYDQTATTVSVSASDESVYYDAATGEETDDPDTDNLDDLYLEHDGGEYLQSDRSSNRRLFGLGSEDEGYRFVVTDLDQDNAWVLDPGEPLSAELCGTTLYTLADDASEVQVYDVTDDDQEPDGVITLSEPPESRTLVVGPTWVGVTTTDGWELFTQ